MADEIQKQKQFYKDHLEFLGCKIEDDPENDQEIEVHYDGMRIFMKIFDTGLRAFVIYRIPSKAKNDRLALLEYINNLNDERIVKISVGMDVFSMEMFYLSTYEKISFGRFMKLFATDARKTLEDAYEKGFVE